MAQDDVLRQFRWYLVENDAPDTAFRFMEAGERLLSMPYIGAEGELRNPAMMGLRFWPVRDFDEFLIFYVVHGGTVRIIRTLHGKRDSMIEEFALRRRNAIQKPQSVLSHV